MVYSSLLLQKWHKYKKTLTNNLKIVSASLTPYLENNDVTKIYISKEHEKILLCELVPNQEENKIINCTLSIGETIILEAEGGNDVDLLIE
ncbi:hypothetical protein H311_01921 [Anncaliia algerae PRA109]|nr:hypothetical protein H311_01921 [Anncaliia algerae PRA109]